MAKRGVIFSFKGNLHKNLVVRALDLILSMLILFGSYRRRKSAAQSLSVTVILTLNELNRGKWKVNFTGAYSHVRFKLSNLTNEH